MTVAELQARISSRELTEWRAFYELEPWGTEAPYVGSGIISSTLANIHRGKNTKAYTISDFMPNQEPKEDQSVDSMIGFASMLTKALGGKDERK